MLIYYLLGPHFASNKNGSEIDIDGSGVDVKKKKKCSEEKTSRMLQ